MALHKPIVGIIFITVVVRR